MSFDYIVNLSAVTQALKDHNTTTASATTTTSPDLSDGLSERINSDNILETDPELTTPRADRLPAIYVMIANKDESAGGIGATGPGKVKKEALVEYEIFGIYGKYGGHSPHSELLTDVYKLARNIEGVFQAEHKLSNTALWCNPVRTEFSPALDIGEGFAKAVLITLQANYMFR